jgi:hypothetical protein
MLRCYHQDAPRVEFSNTSSSHVLDPISPPSYRDSEPRTRDVFPNTSVPSMLSGSTYSGIILVNVMATSLVLHIRVPVFLLPLSWIFIGGGFI